MFTKLKRRLGLKLKLKLNRDEMTFDEVQAEIIKLQQEIGKLSSSAPITKYYETGPALVNLKKRPCNIVH